MTTTTKVRSRTQTGPGTVMGDLDAAILGPPSFRFNLERDGAPIRLMVLVAKPIAKDSAGHVGVMDHRCPHCCASLFLGRE